MWEDLVKYVSEKTTIVVDPGITADLMHYLEASDKVVDFKISAQDQTTYHITILIEKLYEEEVRALFGDLVLFIEYSRFTAYSKIVENDKITFDLVSIGENSGFRCIITFSALH